MLCVPLVLATVYVPGLARVLSVRDPGRAGWMVIGAVSLLPVVVAQGTRWPRRHLPPLSASRLLRA